MDPFKGQRPLHVFLHVFQFGPIGCYSSSASANDTKISKSSRRHVAIRNPIIKVFITDRITNCSP